MSALALTGGTWSTHRGIQRWTPDPPPPPTPPRPRRPRKPPEPRPRPLVYTSPQRAVCPIDGCLLTHPDETCPACLVWAERDAVAASWRRHAA